MAQREKKPDNRSSRILGRKYRYTEDYQVASALGPNGRLEKRVIYTGRWVRILNEEADYRRTVLALRILPPLAVLAILCAVEVLPLPMTHKWYVPVLLISLFPLAYQIMAIFGLPAERKPMERQKYDKSFVRLGHGAVFILVVLCASALGAVIYWIVYAVSGIEGGAPYSLRDGIFALLLVLAAAAELTIYRLYRSIRTDTVDNDAYQP